LTRYSSLTLSPSHPHTPLPDWPFPEPRDFACLCVKQILEDVAPILFVSHDTDGTWQFLTGEDVKMPDARVVGLGEMVDRDPTLIALADLPVDWEAWRATVDAPWERGAAEPLFEERQ
jgi:hypothetical protein